MRTDGTDLRGCIAAALLGLAAVTTATLAGGCSSAPAPSNPNAGLLRDFLDGKFDSAGHPINARVTEAEVLCAGDGPVTDGAVELSATPCTGALAGAEQSGDLVVSARVRVAAHADSGAILSITVTGGDG